MDSLLPYNTDELYMDYTALHIKNTMCIGYKEGDMVCHLIMLTKMELFFRLRLQDGILYLQNVECTFITGNTCLINYWYPHFIFVYAKVLLYMFCLLLIF